MCVCVQALSDCYLETFLPKLHFTTIVKPLQLVKWVTKIKLSKIQDVVWWSHSFLKRLEKQLNYLGVLGDLQESNSLRYPFRLVPLMMIVSVHSWWWSVWVQISLGGFLHPETGYPAWQLLFQKYCLLMLILWVIWGDMSTPGWLSACCFPASGALPSTPVLIHFTIGGETSSLVAEQKMRPTTTCVMTQSVLLWVPVYGFYCNFTVKLWFYQRE